MIEKATKLPFANYDIAVYFGVGVCSLPFFSRYVLSEYPHKFPPIFDGYADPLINSAVAIVALVFTVYVIGHGIALLSSLLVEQFLYKHAGLPSKVIVQSSIPTVQGGSSLRLAIRKQIRETYSQDVSPSDVIRLIFHAPASPVYAVMYFLRLLGFYESKISAFVVFRVEDRLSRCFGYKDGLTSSTGWFKIVEYACANDHPGAMMKMYNYLLIFGVFRSTSFVILCAIWAEDVYWLTMGGIGFLDTSGSGSFLFRTLVLYAAYAVSFIGFAKFSRRYSEEAILAFALSRTFNEPQ